MRSKLLPLLLAAIFFLACMPAAALAASSPAYYLVSHDTVTKISATSFESAVEAARGKTLIVHGGRVSLSKGISMPYGKILLSDTEMHFRGGKFDLVTAPYLLGSSSLTLHGGAEVTFRSFSEKTRFAGGGSSALLTLASGAKYAMRPLGEDRKALNPADEKAVVKRLGGLGEQTAEITISGKVTVNGKNRRLTGDTLYISKGATFAVGKGASLELLNVKVENRGTIRAEGTLTLGRDVGAAALDMLYLMESMRGIKDLDMGKGAASRLDNYGTFTCKEPLVLLGGAVLYNAGEAVLSDVLNAGSFQNTGNLSAHVTGNRIVSARGAQRHLVTFEMGGGQALPVTVAAAAKPGAKLGQLPLDAKTLKELRQLSWFTDSGLNQPWDWEKHAVTKDIVLYAGF